VGEAPSRGHAVVLSVAHGPGHLALSRDAAGELVVLPIEGTAAIELRGHALLVASGTMSYSFFQGAGSPRPRFCPGPTVHGPVRGDG